MKQEHVTTHTDASITEDAYHDARTLQGLREAEQGEGVTVAEARQRMEALIAEQRS